MWKNKLVILEIAIALGLSVYNAYLYYQSKKEEEDESEDATLEGGDDSKGNG